MPNIPLKLIAIGGLGNMLGPSARHLTPHDSATYLRILDRGTTGEQKDVLRNDWLQHGAKLVANLNDLVGDGDFDGVVICAGKNGDDYQIFKHLVALLAKTNKNYFILHLSTVSTNFVRTTAAYCQQQGITYVNYPLTGGAKGAQAKTMLILCSGNQNLYERVLPMLQAIGTPKYFGEKVDLAAAVKLIGHVMVFHGLLGMSLAVVLQKQIFNYPTLNKEQVEFFDFLNQGAGGNKQWEVALRPGVLENHWSQGFLIKHAVIDIIYTAQLILEQPLPSMFIVPLLEVALLFSYILNHSPEKDLTTQAIAQLIATTQKQILDDFLQKNLNTNNIELSLKNCVATLPKDIQQTLMLNICYEKELRL